MPTVLQDALGGVEIHKVFTVTIDFVWYYWNYVPNLSRASHSAVGEY
jgi:hypothetical protein